MKAKTDFNIWVNLGFEGLTEGQVPEAMDIITVVRCGLPGSALCTISEAFEINKTEVCHLLDISKKKKQRWGDKKVDKRTSNHFVLLAKVYQCATIIFGGACKGVSWIKSPCYALGDQVPLQLLDTTEGVKLVLDTLGRIEYGVFA